MKGAGTLLLYGRIDFFPEAGPLTVIHHADNVPGTFVKEKF
jgi:hypothetical protein